MNEQLHMSVSPHIHSGRSTSRIMLDVVIALLPSVVAGTVIFGLRALGVIAVCVISAMLSEYFFNYFAKKEQTVGDMSAVVTGLLLALNLPATVPFWQASIGSVFAIVVVKCFFGGIGQNFANPAIAARVFMLIAFGSMARAAFPVDAVASATPLELIPTGQNPDLITLLLGNHGGAIGETCIVALVAGGIYLLVRRVIKWYCPVFYIGTVFLLTFVLEGFDINATLAWVLSGSLVIGAFFMATDYATTPINAFGKMIFGIGAGLITVMIRFWGVYPEGVSFAILFMNILTPYIDKWTAHKPFGGAAR